jgi:hypothetical protein
MRSFAPGRFGSPAPVFEGSHGQQPISCPRDQNHGQNCRVRVHEPRVTAVQQRMGCGSMKADPTDMGPETTP